MTEMRTPPWPADSRYLQTGDLLIDLCYRRTTCGNVEVELPQRVFDLLLLLMAEPHTLHTRTELFARLWPGVIVEDANLSQSMWLLRKALGEGRKDWVRTVAKGGYVFEPPGPIEAFAELPVAAIAPPDASADRQAGNNDAPAGSEQGNAATPVDASSPDSGTPDAASEPTQDLPLPNMPRGMPVLPQQTAVRRPLLRRWGIWAAAASVAAVIVLAVTWPRGDKSDIPVAQPIRSLQVALVEVEDRANATRWPVKLLHEWLEWKLGSLPQVTLLSEADLAADAAATAPIVVLLSSGNAANAPGQIVLRARYQDAGQEQRIEVKGPLSQAPALVDTLSRQLMERLTPGYAAPWPALELDARAARRYVDVVEAVDRRDWIHAAVIANDVVMMAPRFGLVRLRLAQAQGKLAQASSAIEQMDIARDLLQPIPSEVTELMQAQRLAVHPQRAEQAADAYGKLAARYPGKTGFALEHASLLLDAGQPQQALKILEAGDWQRKSIQTRIARQLTLAQAHQQLGDPQKMRQFARAAERLAQEAGAGWELERGHAQFMRAQADSIQNPGRADTRLYEEAAKQFESAGNPTAALLARFMAEAEGPPVKGANPRLETLLAQARAGGYRRVEIDILTHMAIQHHRAGDLIGYRKFLEQALAATRTSGDVLRANQLEIVLLFEDYSGLRLASADQRLKRLRQTELQGAAGVQLDRMDAGLDGLRGHYLRAIRTLDRAEAPMLSVQPGAAISDIQAQLACSRADYRLPAGDLAGAHVDWKRCAASADPSLQLIAMLGRANTVLLAGDHAAATALLRRAEPLLSGMPDGPDRWTYTILLAGLLTRTGDNAASDRLYAQIAPKLAGSSYLLLYASVEAGLAENAAARGDWTRSQQHIAIARRGLPNDVWVLKYRLDLLDAVATRVAGESKRAAALVTATHDQAHALDDVLAQMEVHSLLPADFVSEDCNPARRAAVVGRTGMRGATLDWLNLMSTQSKAQQVSNAKVR